MTEVEEVDGFESPKRHIMLLPASNPEVENEYVNIKINNPVDAVNREFDGLGDLISQYGLGIHVPEEKQNIEQFTLYITQPDNSYPIITFLGSNRYYWENS